MRFCQMMSFTPPEQVVELARAADEVGFDALSFSDHIVLPLERTTPLPYAAEGMPEYRADSPFLDPLQSIVACAAVTTRLRFYTNIYVLPYRHPLVAAKAAASAAYLTGNRLHFGVGAGWMAEEFELVEQTFERRGARMMEGVEVLRKAWTGEPFEHHGEFYDFGPAQMVPAPTQPIPLLVGGHSELALRRAAAVGDGWMGVDYQPDELRAILTRLRALRDDAGRGHLPFDVVTGLWALPTPDVVAEFEELGLTTMLTSAFGFDVPSATDAGANRARLEAFAEAFIRPLR